MYPTTGFTPTMDERTRLRNGFKTCMQLRRDNLLNLDAFTYWTNRAKSDLRQLRALNAAQAADDDNATITARLEWLEGAIDEAAPDAVPEMLTEIIELRNRLQLDGWADEQFDGRMMARNLSDTY